MNGLNIILEEPAWPELADRGDDVIHISEGNILGLAVLDGGMTSGKPSVALRIDLPDGKVVIAETSARLLCTAAQTILARYPNLLDEGVSPIQSH